MMGRLKSHPVNVLLAIAVLILLVAAISAGDFLIVLAGVILLATQFLQIFTGDDK